MIDDRFKFRFWNKLRKAYENTYDLKCCEHLDYVVPEQCTGLRDKNGKLIYENDIVKNGKHIYPVEWCVNGFAVNDGYDYLVDNEEWEVIGNIHENEDLLKVGEK